MKLFLMRHGEAVQPKNGSKDSERPLTDFGVQQSKSIAHHLQDVRLHKIISSDYLRTRQTAEHVQTSMNYDVNVELSDRLRPMVDVNNSFNFILDELLSLSESESLLIVTHMPLVADLCSYAVNGRVNGEQGFGTANIALLESDTLAPACFNLQWLKTP